MKSMLKKDGMRVVLVVLGSVLYALNVNTFVTAAWIL